VAGFVGVVRLRLAQNKKGGPLRPPPVTQRRMICGAQIEPRGEVCKVGRGVSSGNRVNGPIR
jgi:hypothetical protein